MNIIQTEVDYQAALAAIEPYLQKGFANLSQEEDKELARIYSLIEEEYEAFTYTMPFKLKTLTE